MIDNHLESRGALDKLIAAAAQYVTHSMEKTGKLSPTLFIHGVDGNAVLQPKELQNVRSKDEFVQVAKVVCIAHGADATVFVSEAWSKFAKQDEKLDLTKAPSEYKDREEVVIMIGETRHFNKQRILPMERSAEGEFKGFGDERVVEADNVKGRFSNFIPPTNPDDETRDLAKEALRHLGVAVAKKRAQEQYRGRF